MASNRPSLDSGSLSRFSFPASEKILSPVDQAEDDDDVVLHSINESVGADDEFSVCTFWQFGNFASSLGHILEALPRGFDSLEEIGSGSRRLLEKVLQVGNKIVAGGVSPDYFFSHSAVSRITCS